MDTGEKAREQFHQDFNVFHPSIKLTLEHSEHQVNFLDTTIKIINGCLVTSVYKKPTDRNSYLHASSFHPPHTTKSIVYSQALRYNRICSDTKDQDQHLTTLHGSFTALKYNNKTVSEQIAKAKCWTWDELLQYRPRDSKDRTPLVVTYSPQLKPLQRIINELNPILDNDDTLKHIFKEKPLIAYRQPPNLRAHLVRSTLNSPNIGGTRPCNGPRCQLCPHINTDTWITGPNNVPCCINGSFTCNSTDVVYAITCQHCPSAVYIGQTGQSLRQRMNSHKFDIRNNDPQKPVSMHFNQPGHSLQHFKVAVLRQGPFKSRLQREAVEQNIIQKLDCIKHGLNRDSGFFSHYQD